MYFFFYLSIISYFSKLFILIRFNNVFKFLKVYGEYVKKRILFTIKYFTGLSFL